MSIFKPFITSDVIVSPFKVNKTFLYNGTAALTGSGVDLFIGDNIEPLLWVSGSNPTGYNTIQDQFLIYRSIRELYYSNFLYGDDGSPANTASFNPDGTITGPEYEPSYYNYLSNTLPANRYFPTGSNEIIGVISIPSNLFGEYIKPGTCHYYHMEQVVLLLMMAKEILITGSSLKLGDMVYEHGMAILTNDGAPGLSGHGFGTYGSVLYDYNDVSFIKSFITCSNVTCSFKSTITIYESQYKCTIKRKRI
jgi:hypothetical protein